jgi:hypothetical protein
MKFNLYLHSLFNGGLAQLVQSICLTSRGSAVRTRQPPQFRLKVGGSVPPERDQPPPSLSPVYNGVFYYVPRYVIYSEKQTGTTKTVIINQTTQITILFYNDHYSYKFKITNVIIINSLRETCHNIM